ncbi:MAG: diguanylate cyclase [Lachnospiraceae bacterium]|nr:diguanylate cyclase [Lachnospiraceae bacterium]
MQKFSPLAYIRKFQFLIIFGALASGMVFYGYFASKQTYTVSAIIEYTNAKASEGYSPDGKKIDTSEIYSVSVMQDVFDRMNLAYDSYNLDQFRSRVVVTPILSEEEKAMQEAQNGVGEESTVKATKYMVSFTASRKDSDQPGDFARQVLDNMLDAYLADYAENHIGGGTIVNNLSGLYDGNYDYLEMIETIDEDVRKTIQSLYNRVNMLQNNPLYYHRSVSTGYTFMDLYREFNSIYKTDVPNIYAYILNNRASRDPDILISKYQKRIGDYEISNSAKGSQSNEILRIIESYVRMMRESGNTNITYEYILNDVDDDYYRYLQQDEDGNAGGNWERPDETVKYDVLLEDYVANSTNIEQDKLNIAYCQYIIGVFSGAAPAANDADVETGSEEAPQTVAPTPEINGTAEAMLDSVISRLNELYHLLDRTMVEYNEYAGAANISLGSNVVLQGGRRLVLYSGVVIVVCSVLLSAVVVVLSRIGEIFHYYVYVDHKFQLANRSACDRYMEGYSNRILPESFSCIAVIADDVRQKNEQYGVEACDGMLRRLIEILQSAFASVGDSFISVNGLGQFIIFVKNISYGQAESCMRYAASVVNGYNESAECKISYRYGITESRHDSIYQIKMLMLKAIEKCSRPEESTVRAGLPQKPAGAEPGEQRTEASLSTVAQMIECLQETSSHREPDHDQAVSKVQESENVEASDGRTIGNPDSNVEARLDQLLERLEKARSNQ